MELDENPNETEIPTRHVVLFTVVGILILWGIYAGIASFFHSDDCATFISSYEAMPAHQQPREGQRRRYSECVGLK